MKSEAPIVTEPIVISKIPRTLAEDFKEWCDKRGYTLTGKVRRLMDSYVRGRIDDGTKNHFHKPHWKSLKKRHSLEWKRLCRQYPDDDMVSICIQNVPKELKERFRVYCQLHGYTTAGKLRMIMLDCINGNLKYKGHTFKS